MKTLTIVQAFSKVRREVEVDGFDPFARVVRVRFGGCAGLFRFCYESGQGVEPEAENWLLADLQAVREHVYAQGFEPGPLREPTFRDQPKAPRPPPAKPPDPRQRNLFEETTEIIDRIRDTVTAGQASTNAQLAAVNKRMALGARRTTHRFRLGGAR